MFVRIVEEWNIVILKMHLTDFFLIDQKGK